MKSESCPNEATLLAFVSSKLSDDDVASVAAHLDACPNCLELVVELAKPAGIRSEQSTPRYRIQGPIAEGGMGVVLAAMDQQLGRSVALKTVRDDNPVARARFEWEVKVTAQLEHPSIVPVYDGGVFDDGTPFYVMRRVEGRELEVCIRNARSLGERLALIPSYIDLVDAVAYAHSEGFIHRDLKPRNILVGSYGETIVLDWGLAKHLSSPGSSSPTSPSPAQNLEGQPEVTEVGTVVGTAGYMAPEVRAGTPASTRSDVYSLGSILRRLLTGESGHELQEKEPVPGAAPADLVAIMRRARAARAADRYHNAQALAEDLRRFQAGRLVEARTYGWTDRAIRFCRRHAAVLGSLSAAGLVVAVSTAWAFVGVTTARDSARDALELARGAEAAARSERESAEDLIDFALLDLSKELRASGRSDALSRLARRVDQYYGDRTGPLRGARAVRKARAIAIQADVASQRGDWATAEDEWRLLRTLAATAETEPEVAPEARRLRIRAESKRAGALVNSGRVEEGLAIARNAVDEARALPDSAESRILLGAALVRLTLLLEYTGYPDEAVRSATEAASLARDHQGARRPELLLVAARANSFLGRSANSNADFGSARNKLLEAIKLAEEYRSIRPASVDTLELLAADRFQMGQLEASLTELEASKPHLAEAVRNYDLVRSLRPESVMTVLKLSDTRTSLASVLVETGSPERAELVLLDDIEDLSELVKQNPSLLQGVESLGFAEVSLGRVLSKLGKTSPANEAFERGLARLASLPFAELSPGSKSRLAHAHFLAGWFYGDTVQPERALPVLKTARNLRAELAGESFAPPEALSLAEVDIRIGLAHAQLGQRKLGRERLRSARSAVEDARTAGVPAGILEVLTEGCDSLADELRVLEGQRGTGKGRAR